MGGKREALSVSETRKLHIPNAGFTMAWPNVYASARQPIFKGFSNGTGNLDCFRKSYFVYTPIPAAIFGTAFFAQPAS